MTLSKNRIDYRPSSGKNRSVCVKGAVRRRPPLTTREKESPACSVPGPAYSAQEVKFRGGSTSALSLADITHSSPTLRRSPSSPSSLAAVLPPRAFHRSVVTSPSVFASGQPEAPAPVAEEGRHVREEAAKGVDREHDVPAPVPLQVDDHPPQPLHPAGAVDELADRVGKVANVVAGLVERRQAQHADAEVAQEVPRDGAAVWGEVLL